MSSFSLSTPTFAYLFTTLNMVSVSSWPISNLLYVIDHIITFIKERIE